MKNLRYQLLKSIASLALFVTMVTVNSTCVFDYYQPKVPESAKRLKK